MTNHPRVVSLLPSATESLCAVGGEHLLVGRSHECDWPPSVLRLPSVTSQRIHDTDSARIDALVREHSTHTADETPAAQSLYRLDEDALRQLAPDIILTQDLCGVCCIHLDTVTAIAASMSSRPQVISLNPGTVEDILDDLLRIGNQVGLAGLATDAVVALRERLFAAGEFVNPFDDGPSFAFLEWTDPLFVGGHWTVQLIERAGATHPLNPTTIAAPHAGAAAGPQHGERKAGHSFVVSPQALLASLPQSLVICPCGFNLEKSFAAAELLALQPWWNDLPAVRNGRVAVVDGTQMFNRPGPRVVDAFEWLVGWLHEVATPLGPHSLTFPWRPLRT